MTLQHELQSVVRLDKLYVDHISVSRSGEPVSTADLKIRFKKNYQFAEGHRACQASLSCQIYAEAESLFTLDVGVTGRFACDEESDERREILLQKNTIAILFPYLRSQISLVTAQPELAPLVLPPVNVEALFDQLAEEPDDADRCEAL